MTSPYDIDQFIIRKNYILTDLDSLIEAAIQSNNPLEMQTALSNSHHPLLHDDVTGVEIDAAKMAYDFGVVGRDVAQIFHEGPTNPRFMEAFQIMVKAGAPLINQAISRMAVMGKPLPKAFDQAGQVTPAWRMGVSARKRMDGSIPMFDEQGRLVTSVQSSYSNQPEAWNRPYREGLAEMRKLKGIGGKTRPTIRPGLFHRNSVNIQDGKMMARYFELIKDAISKNPGVDPREVAHNALKSDARFQVNSGLQHSDFNAGYARYHEDNIDATNQAMESQERMENGADWINPELFGTKGFDAQGRIQNAYRKGTIGSFNQRFGEANGMSAEEAGEMLARVAQASAGQSGAYSRNLREALRQHHMKDGVAPEWYKGPPASEPVTAQPQEPVTEGQPAERRVPAERPVTEGPQAQSPEWDPFNLDTYGGQPAAPPPPMEQPAPPPPRDESMDRARPATPERHAQPAPEQPPRPPRGPPQRTPQQAVMAAPPAPQPMAQPERRGYVVSPLGRPVSELPAMQRLAYLLGQRSNLFGKSEDDAHLVREALEAVQIDIAKSEVPPRFMGMGLNVNSLSDVSMAANAVRVTPQDVVSIVHSRGDWDGIAKSFNVTVQDVQKVKVMFNG